MRNESVRDGPAKPGLRLRAATPRCAREALARLRLHVARLALALLASLLAPAARAAQPHRLEPTDLEAFFDGLLRGLMEERHVPGAVVLLVRNGEVIFSKGYGVADLESRRSVDPETTLFRVASVSKLFTATAALQLVEQGRLALDADVNRDLDEFEIPPAFGKPVTLAHLLTHTAGFDDSFLGSAQPLAAQPVPLGAYLARRMPPRVMPPGELLSYSNHGIALAGYLVERASGEPFEQYVRRHILEPLGMTRTGFGLPNPPPAELALGYDWRDGRYLASGLDRILMGPAGDLYTSAGEIARFMLAHLQGGALGPARILREDTARLMQSTQFRHHPRQIGWCYGFAEGRRRGLRTIRHGGSWRGYGTELVLVPEVQLGLFLSTNRDNDPRFFEPLLDAFFERYFPGPAPAPLPAPPPGYADRAQPDAGTYLPNRHVRSDVLKLGLFLSEARVTTNEDGSLTFHSPGDVVDPLRLVEIEPDLFAVDGKEQLVSVRRDAQGRVAHLILDTFALDRVPWYRSPSAHRAAAALCAFLFALTALGYPFGALVRALAGGPAASAPGAARAIAVAVSTLNLAVLLVIAVALGRVSPYELFEGVPLWLTAVSLVPLVSIPLSLLLPYHLLVGRGHWTPLGRIHFLLLCLAAVVFAVFIWYWNLLGVVR